MIVSIELRPGVYRNGTELQAKNRWRDCNLVRWHEGVLRPVGGWEAFVSEEWTKPPRGAVGWQDNSGSRYMALGTYEKLYIVQADGTVTDITPGTFTAGSEEAAINTGFGGGIYGRGVYGAPRDDSTEYGEATTWSLDTWGEYLVGVSTSDGRILEWQLNTANDAAQVSNSPTNCKGLVVTSGPFLVALQADGDVRKVAWSDRADNTTWAPTALNEAGDFALDTDGELMQALNIRGQTLLLTNVDAHTMTEVGGVAVFGFKRVDNAGGVISRHAGVGLGGIAYWMGERGFFRYAGGVADPLQCEVGDYVFGRLNPSRKSHIWGVSNRLFGEVWWFYASNQSTDIDSYVVYNVNENHWNTGQLVRTAGFDQGAWRYPFWMDDSAAYQHEYAYTLGTTPYAETGPLILDGGDRMMWVDELIPDEKVQGEVEATFKVRYYPNATEYEYGPYSMSNPTGVRFQGRQIRMRVEGTDGQDWRVGIPRIDARPTGRR